MQSLANFSDRHTVVARKEGQYLAFPDIASTRTGRLICVWRESDCHVATESRLMLKISDDRGATWSAERVLNPFCGHMPRITVLASGEILILDDGAPPAQEQEGGFWPSIYRSQDDGETFTAQPLSYGFGSCIPACPSFGPDRILPLAQDDWLCMSQIRLGTVRRSAWHTFANMVYRSTDQGKTWWADTPACAETDLLLCESGLTLLPDGRILALYRTNSERFEPVYWQISEDRGRTWTAVKATPLVGHRPNVGLTGDGRLLVTYRNVSPDRGTCAWMGTLEALTQTDYLTQALVEDESLLVLHADRLVAHNDPARNSKCCFILRPISDRRYASATLALTYDASHACGNFGVQFGGAWRPLEGKGTIKIALEPGTANPAVVVGNDPAAPSKGLEGEFSLSWMDYTTHEPRHLRDYHWQWSPADGYPHARAQSTQLMLAPVNASVSLGDMGYSGWTKVGEGEFLAAYHHVEEAGKNSYIQTMRIFAGDFA